MGAPRAASDSPRTAPGRVTGGTPARRRPGSPLRVLALSLFVLRFGSTMTAVGLPLMVVHRYGAGFDAGLTLALELLPNVLFGAVIGDVIDRTDPRRLAILGPLLSAPVVALIPATTELWQIQALGLLAGVGYLVGLPARMALRSQVIPPGAETAGNGLLVASQRLPMLLGPTAAAVLIPFGYTALFLTDAATAVLAAAILFALPPRPRPPHSRPPHSHPACTGPPRAPGARAARWAVRARAAARSALRRLFTESIPGLARMVAADRALAALTATAFTYMFGYGMTRLFLATYAISRFPHHAGFFGLLGAAMGAGAVLGSLTAARFARFSQGHLYVAVNLLESGCWLCLVLLHDPAAALAAVALAGVCESIGTVVFYAEAQTRLPANSEGRFFAMLIPLSDSFFVLGTVTTGVVVTNGVVPAAWIIAATMAVPVLALCPLFLRRRLWPGREPTTSGRRESEE
ncbi:MFS transporter [Actinomadura scrupuli]|uniref:MFS transporter n=1 Tax=Actinomadura scrupuli TaxID=559629 RepID=UPI003D977315